MLTYVVVSLNSRLESNEKEVMDGEKADVECRQRDREVREESDQRREREREGNSDKGEREIVT